MNLQVGLKNPTNVLHNPFLNFLFIACYYMTPISHWPAFAAFFLGIIMISRMPSITEIFFIILVIITLMFYYIIGGVEIMPKPMGIMDGLKRLTGSCCILVPLFFVRRHVAVMALKAICYGVILTDVWVIIYTVINAPQLLISRAILLPWTKELVNSPLVANTIPLAAGMLILIFGSVIGWISLVISFILSIILANRTGIILSSIIFVVALYFFYRKNRNNRPSKYIRIKNIFKRYVTPFLFIIFLIILSFTLYEKWDFNLFTENLFGRFMEEGLKSDRFSLQADGLYAILSGEALFGGKQIMTGLSIWYHNIFLDAYRVAGVPGLILMFLTILLSFFVVCKSKNIPLVIIWFLNFVVLMSSVVFESAIIEFAITFSILSAPFLFYKKENKILRTQEIKSGTS